MNFRKMCFLYSVNLYRQIIYNTSNLVSLSIVNNMPEIRIIYSKGYLTILKQKIKKNDIYCGGGGLE